MIVYRVEHSDGHGPYNFSTAEGEIRTGDMAELNARLCVAHNDSAHPSPREDNVPNCMGWTIPGVCGFESLSALAAWFEGWGQELADHGFMIKVFEIDAQWVSAGNRQLVFMPHASRLNGVMQVTDHVT